MWKGCCLRDEQKEMEGISLPVLLMPSPFWRSRKRACIFLLTATHSSSFISTTLVYVSLKDLKPTVRSAKTL